jgi:hypothetical protein
MICTFPRMREASLSVSIKFISAQVALNRVGLRSLCYSYDVVKPSGFSIQMLAQLDLPTWDKRQKIIKNNLIDQHKVAKFGETHLKFFYFVLYLAHT